MGIGGPYSACWGIPWLWSILCCCCSIPAPPVDQEDYILLILYEALDFFRGSAKVGWYISWESIRLILLVVVHLSCPTILQVSMPCGPFTLTMPHHPGTSFSGVKFISHFSNKNLTRYLLRWHTNFSRIQTLPGMPLTSWFWLSPPQPLVSYLRGELLPIMYLNCFYKSINMTRNM